MMTHPTVILPGIGSESLYRSIPDTDSIFPLSAGIEYRISNRYHRYRYQYFGCIVSEIFEKKITKISLRYNTQKNT